MRLIGLRCKHGDMLSQQILIGRGLFLLSEFKTLTFLINLKKSAGVNGDEVPPVPIPNTEVKLICVEDTWMVTSWENISMPGITIQRTGKRQSLSQQTQKDQELTVQRLKKNEQMIPTVTHFLELVLGKSPQKKLLLSLATQLTSITHIQLDRLAKRSRDCLLCWFCENWELFLPHLSEISSPSSPSSPSLSQIQSTNSPSRALGEINSCLPQPVVPKSSEKLETIEFAAPVDSSFGFEAATNTAFDGISDVHGIDEVVADFFSDEILFLNEDSELPENLFCSWN